MSSFSYLSHLECPKCHSHYSADAVQQLCQCGSPLLARYDLERLSREVDRAQVTRRNPDLWRYHELLPVQEEANIVSLGEGMTPLLPLRRLGEEIGIPNLLLKDEGLVPTGTFKARGAAVGISRAKELGVRTFAMPTNGNAGAAWAVYAARAGIEAKIVMPVDAPKITRNECAVAGASLHLVNGLISDAGKIVGKAVQANGWFDASTLKEPYRLEGKKTMGIEIAEQLGWRVPDVILYPTGGGVGIIGIYKALLELRELGWIPDGKMPRLVAVQATGCAPIVKAWEEKAKSSVFWEDAWTIAFGITVPKALGDFLVLEALYETDGCAIAISDEELLGEQQRIATLEGAFICPEGAATVVAARKLRESGWVRDGEEVVVLNTGTGIKYPDTVQVDVPVLQPDDELPQ